MSVCLSVCPSVCPSVTVCIGASGYFRNDITWKWITSCTFPVKQLELKSYNLINPIFGGVKIERILPIILLRVRYKPLTSQHTIMWSNSNAVPLCSSVLVDNNCLLSAVSTVISDCHLESIPSAHLQLVSEQCDWRDSGIRTRRRFPFSQPRHRWQVTGDRWQDQGTGDRTKALGGGMIH